MAKKRGETGPPERGNPQEPVSLAAEAVQGGFDEIAKLPQRVIRYGAAKARALENVAWLAQVGQFIPESEYLRERRKKLGLRILECGEYLVFRQYFTVGLVRLHAAHFCKAHLLCPLCAIRRGAKALAAYMERFQVIQGKHPGLKFSLVTVTVKNGDDLAERMAHVKKAVKELLRRRTRANTGGRHQTEWAKVLGGFGSYEVTNKGKGWHPHCHIIVVHQKRLNYAAMQREWERVTKDSIFLNVQAGRHPQAPEQDFMEVTKYAVKFGDLTPEQNVHVYETLQGQRLCFCFGEFRGVEIPEELTDDCQDLDALPYIELFYRYLDGGYSLTKTDVRDSRSDDEEDVGRRGRTTPERNQESLEAS